MSARAAGIHGLWRNHEHRYKGINVYMVQSTGSVEPQLRLRPIITLTFLLLPACFCILAQLHYSRQSLS